MYQKLLHTGKLYHLTYYNKSIDIEDTNWLHFWFGNFGVVLAKLVYMDYAKSCASKPL